MKTNRWKFAVLMLAASAVVTAQPPAGEIQLVGAAGFDGAVVKGAPYSATAVNETTQMLADGNRIRNQSSSQIYRDSEGRTRREASLFGIAPGVELPQLVFISDPVAGYSYVLDLKARTAQRSKLVPPDQRLGELKAKIAGEHGEKFEMHVAGAAGAVGPQHTVMYRTVTSNVQSGKAESLGQKSVEGVLADGTRSTATIEANKMGNERPIEIVSERWYSSELHALVESRHSDPRMGETVYRLTNISRSEPARSLFEVPADFGVTESKGDNTFQMKIDRRIKD